MRVAVTGCAGKIGREIVEELSGNHELSLIDRLQMPGRLSSIVDLAQHRVRNRRRPWLKQRLPPWMSIFDGIDVVIHLAADPAPSAAWQGLIRNNIQATWNVIEAAAIHHVPRIVFASSNWTVKALENKLAPDCYKPEGPKIGSDVPPSPLTAYGLSKAVGEIAGRMFVEDGKLHCFIAVRIGYYNRQPPTDELLRRRWIGSDDIRSLFRRCVDAEVNGFHVVYGVSAQPIVPYDLSHTAELIGWKPRQTLLSRTANS